MDYIYMPDRMVEDARNVTINLHGEHGKFVMIQLFFSDKWMLISEITFTSSKSFFLSPLGVFSSRCLFPTMFRKTHFLAMGP